MHIWFIMDWNRRFAKNLWKDSVYWHKKWFDNLKKIIKLCKKNKIEYSTFWCLSVENIKNRSTSEINFLYELISETSKIADNKKDFHKVRFKTIWDLSLLPEKVQKSLKEMELKTANDYEITITLAIAYSWQDEIIRANRRMEKDDSKADFRSYLDTSFLPDTDLIVRTWWDFRHSWFLLYISAYSQYFFTDKKWPEFSEEEFYKAIDFLNNSKRTFWK